MVLFFENVWKYQQFVTFMPIASEARQSLHFSIDRHALLAMTSEHYFRMN